MGRISSIRLQNIQSWDKDSPILELSYDKFNAIIARSETGKSVFFKSNITMCFPNFWGRRTRKGLIRRKCEHGTYAMQLENGNKSEELGEPGITNKFFLS